MEIKLDNCFVTMWRSWSYVAYDDEVQDSHFDLEADSEEDIDTNNSQLFG